MSSRNSTRRSKSSSTTNRTSPKVHVASQKRGSKTSRQASRTHSSNSKRKQQRRASSKTGTYSGNLEYTGPVIGAMTRPNGKGLFRSWLSSRKTQTPFVGDTALEGQVLANVKSVWEQSGLPLPGRINLCELDPGAVQNLGRANKRKLLRVLEEEYGDTKMCVAIQKSGDKAGESGAGAGAKLLEEVTPRGGVELSLAAVLALAVAFKEQRTLFAELVGCAQPRTVKQLSPFLQPPLITMDELPVLLNSASRGITLGRAERSSQPVQLAVRTADAVAAVLAHGSESQRRGKDDVEARHARVKNLVRKAILYGNPEEDNDESRGCRVGMLLAGIQKFVLDRSADIDKKVETCNLFIDLSANLLTGTPVFGFALGAGGTLVKYLAAKGLSNGKKNLRALSDAVKVEFDEGIGSLIFLDGEVELDVGDRKETIKVDDKVFSRWYDKILSWNAQEIYWMGRQF